MEKGEVYRTRTILQTVGILVFTLLVSGCDANEEFQKTVQLTKPFDSGKQFEAGTHNGSIRASGHKTGTCEISATITGRGPTVEDARKIADSININLEYHADKLLARIDKPASLETRYYGVDYHIRLPSTTSLELSTHNGSIRVGKISGALHVSTHNGGIECDDVSGRVRAQTHNGSVEVHFDSEAASPMKTSITTHNGSIEIYAPPDLSAELDAATHNGKIAVFKPVTVNGIIEKSKVRGKIGTGLGSLRLRTHNGAITVR